MEKDDGLNTGYPLFVKNAFVQGNMHNISSLSGRLIHCWNSAAYFS